MIQASTLGIQSSRYSPYGRGAPRGRARGRGARGSYVAARPMRLDNRSRSIIITGEALQQSEAHQPIKEWYEENGGNMSVNENGVVFTFPNREMAEKVSLTFKLYSIRLTSRYLLLEPLQFPVKQAN
jgi:RNA-binding protein 26